MRKYICEEQEWSFLLFKSFAKMSCPISLVSCHLRVPLIRLAPNNRTRVKLGPRSVLMCRRSNLLDHVTVGIRLRQLRARVQAARIKIATSAIGTWQNTACRAACPRGKIDIASPVHPLVNRPSASFRPGHSGRKSRRRTRDAAPATMPLFVMPRRRLGLGYAKPIGTTRSLSAPCTSVMP